MPNLFKRFSTLVKAEPYKFPDAGEMKEKEEKQPELEEFFLEEELDRREETPPQDEEAAQGEELPQQTDPAADPVRYAQIQAEMLLKDARKEAEILQARVMEEAEKEAQNIREAAREEGRQAGYADGLAQGRQEAAQELEAMGAAQAEAVQKFLDKAGAALDRQLDGYVEDLRDLAVSIAEKVICVSLKSSSDVICRMIQAAIDKRKRREWVHIYIAECDAKRLGQIPASLTAALSALSDRVRIIPMADDESGTCIIEMPDEIVDASAATQLNNIRGLLTDTASSSSSGSLF